MAFWHDIFNRCYCIHINLVCFVDGARPAAVSDADDDAIYCISPQYVTLFLSSYVLNSQRLPLLNNCPSTVRAPLHSLSHFHATPPALAGRCAAFIIGGCPARLYLPCL